MLKVTGWLGCGLETQIQVTDSKLWALCLQLADCSKNSLTKHFKEIIITKQLFS